MSDVTENDVAVAVLRAELREARRLLTAFTEYHGDDCRFDHHGYCQEHFLEATPNQCTVRDAKAFLEAASTPTAKGVP